MRNRWYEPYSGRFLSEDPIGLDGGMNPSVFARNDPVNLSDPSGLQERIPGVCHAGTRCAGPSSGTSLPFNWPRDYELPWGVASSHPVGDLVGIGRGLIALSDAARQSIANMRDPCNAAMEDTFKSAVFDYVTFGVGRMFAVGARRFATMAGLANDSRVILSGLGRANAVGAAVREVSYLNSKASTVIASGLVGSTVSASGVVPFLNSGNWLDAVGAIPLPGANTVAGIGKAVAACR